MQPFSTRGTHVRSQADRIQMLTQLPRTRAEAAKIAKESAFVREALPAGIISAYTQDAE